MRLGLVMIVLLLVLSGVVVAIYRDVDRKAQVTREASKMRSVQVITSEGLSRYYEDHGRFPDSLSELPMDKLRWGDEGSSPRDLQSWNYTSDGHSFTMSWTNELKWSLLLQGTNGVVFFR
jgi:hypothetical protein